MSIFGLTKQHIRLTIEIAYHPNRKEIVESIFRHLRLLEHRSLHWLDQWEDIIGFEHVRPDTYTSEKLSNYLR